MKVEPMKNQPLISIGVNKGAVIEARKTLLAIIKAAPDREVAVEAIKALTALCQTTNTTITNCVFNQK